MSYNEKLPEWNDPGVEPPQSKKDAGFSPGEKPPAQWFNWLLNRVYKSIEEIREKVVIKVTGKDLSSNDYTDEDKVKLRGIEVGATKYVHPPTHPASMIEESEGKRFVSDTEKVSWNSKETPSGAQAKANIAEANAKTYTDIHEQKAAPHSGHETPSGAQAKANAALTSANSYTNQEVTATKGLIGTISGLLTTAKGNLVVAVNEIFNDLKTHKNDNTSAHGVNTKMPIAGGDFTGITTAQSNTSYTVRQVRNIIISLDDANVGSMQDGDIWIKYK